MESKDKERDGEPGYILVDFDRTLATYTSFDRDGQKLGEPIPAMVERVQRWLHTGEDVRIFTARASRYNVKEREAIEAWCQAHVGKVLPIQNWKCFKCKAIWDDLAVTVEANTGWRLTMDEMGDPLDADEETDLFRKLAD